MSTSIYLCDITRQIAFELGSDQSYAGFDVNCVLFIEEILKSLQGRFQDSPEKTLALATHIHNFAKEAMFDVEIRMYHELPFGWKYEGGAWNIADAMLRLQKRKE